MCDIRRFMDQFFQGIIDRRIEAVIDSYAHDDQLFVFLEGPRSRTIGWNNVRSGWEHYLISDIHLKSITWGDDLQVRDYGDTGWVAGSNLITVVIADGLPKTLETRGTWFLEKREGQWRIVHEHVSLPNPDPYGVGDWVQTK